MALKNLHLEFVNGMKWFSPRNLSPAPDNK